MRTRPQSPGVWTDCYTGLVAGSRALFCGLSFVQGEGRWGKVAIDKAYC
jgi:hypothetical protein